MYGTIVHCKYNNIELFSQIAPLKLYDTTLRDGEQTVGVSLNRYKKLEIAQMLEEIGVPRIECGMPAASKEDFKAAQLILNNIRSSEVWGFCRCMKSDIDACLEIGIKNIICELPLSDVKHKAYCLTKDKVLNRLTDAIGYAKSQGMYVSFFGIDATRTDIDFLQKTYTTAVNMMKADEVVAVDTLGIASPQGMASMVKMMKSWVSVPIGVHCHDDMNMGVACTLAAIIEGASEAHVTVNGLGERTGNVDLASLVMAAKVLYDIPVEIDYSKLFHLSNRVAVLAGVPLPATKAVTGPNVFKRESGLTVAQVIEYPPSVEPFPPDMIGSKREVVLGKSSGKASIEYMLDQHGITATNDQKLEILEEVKKLGTEKEGILTDNEFMQIVKYVTRAAQ